MNPHPTNELRGRARAAFLARMHGKIHPDCKADGTPAPSKYRNRKTTVDGITFDSKKEADFYTRLTRLQAAKAVSWFIRQVPFDLPGGVKYRADFLVVDQHQGVIVYDVKGYRTEVYRLKKRQVEALYGIKIVEV